MLEHDDIGALIKILSEAIGQKANRHFRKFNLTLQQMKIVGYLKENEGKREVSQRDIQNHMKSSHVTVVNMIKGMEQKGFVRTAQSTKDRRMKIVTLTGHEKDSVKEVLEGKEKVNQQLLKGLTKEEQENIKKYLKIMYENMKES